MNKLKNWLANRLPIIQGIILILFFIISLIAGLNRWQNALMISLLLFIGCEFFLLIVGYLEQIISYIKNETTIIQTKSGQTDLIKLLSSAKSNIIISGSSLSSLNSVRHWLKKLPENIDVELYNINPDYLEKYPHLCNIINCENPDVFRKEYDFFKVHILNYLKDKQNIHMYSVEYVSPITFIGIDTNTRSTNSQILGEHYVLGDDCDLAFVAKSGLQLYDIYATQLHEIRQKPHIQLN